MLARASADVRLRPGDLIGSGTVGTGCLLEVRDADARPLPRARRRGRPCAIERLGALRTPIVARRDPDVARCAVAGERSARIEPMTADDWPAVRRIYAEGIATGDATLEHEAPDWSHFDRSHPPRLPAGRARRRGGTVVGWTALGQYSGRKVYSGVAWESVYVAADARGRGVGRALLEALIPASEAAGFWTLLAGVLADNTASLALPRARRLPADRRADGLGQEPARAMA